VCAGHRWGYKKRVGHVGGRSGRETRRRARVRMRRSTATRGEAGADKAGPRHRERKVGAQGQRFGTGELGLRNREREREGERAGEVTGADMLAPLDNERGREGARERGLSLTGGVRLSGAAGARGTGPGGLVWAEMAFSFPWIF
jgi:hypothetical protein